MDDYFSRVSPSYVQTRGPRRFLIQRELFEVSCAQKRDEEQRGNEQKTVKWGERKERSTGGQKKQIESVAMERRGKERKGEQINR